MRRAEVEPRETLHVCLDLDIVVPYSALAYKPRDAFTQFFAAELRHSAHGRQRLLKSVVVLLQEYRPAICYAHHFVYRRHIETSEVHGGLKSSDHVFDCRLHLTQWDLAVVEDHVDSSVVVELLDVSYLGSGASCCFYQPFREFVLHLIASVSARAPLSDDPYMSVQAQRDVDTRLCILRGYKAAITSIFPDRRERLLQLARIQFAHMFQIRTVITPLHELGEGKLLGLRTGLVVVFDDVAVKIDHAAREHHIADPDRRE